jgi:uncharacterized membrane protein YeaQ/YmgE (transglycosylase-associated protein family)
VAVDIPGVLAWFIVGMLTGAIATQSLAGRGYGRGPDIGIGILGGLAAGFAVSLAGIRGQSGLLASTVAAFAGALLLTALARRVRGTGYIW